MVFCVGVGQGEEKNSTGFVVSVLAAEVEGSEAGAVGGVDVSAVLAQQRRRLAVAAPCHFVQRAVQMLQSHFQTKLYQITFKFNIKISDLLIYWDVISSA